VIHYSAGDPKAAARAKAIAARVAEPGGATVEIRSVATQLKQDSVRLFFDADHRVAVRVRDAIGGEGTPVRDFRHYRPQPRPGTIEVWIGTPD
jgi:hypothetical protein